MMQIDTKASGSVDPQKVIKPTRRRIVRALFRAGGLGHKIAKRSLRKARKIRVSELPDDDAERHREAVEDYKNGYRDTMPVLRDIISDPGKPPLIHDPNSPLKQLTRFAVDEQKLTVVWGPKRARSAIAGDLEGGKGSIKNARPWVGPSLQNVLPKLPASLKASN